MMKRPVALLACVVAVCFAVALFSRTARGAVSSAPLFISGQVVMGTAGVSLPPELKVDAVQLSSAKEGQTRVQGSASTAADGSFRIELPGQGTENPGRFLVSTVFQQVTYSDVIEPKTTEQPVRLTVFDVTADSSVVSIDSDTTTVLEGKGNELEIFQLLRVRNNSDRTFVGKGPGQPRAVVVLALPEGAFDLSPAEAVNPNGIASTSQGVATTSPLLPGQSSISFLYKVRANRAGWQFRKEVFYPTRKADLLIGPSLALNAAPGFKFQERKKLGGPTYERHSAGPLQAGVPLGADIGFDTDEGSTGLWWGLAFGASVLGAIIFGGSLWLRKTRSRHSAESGQVDEGDREALIEKIARLDQQFDEGAIGESLYKKRRGQMKTQLAQAGQAGPERSV